MSEPSKVIEKYINKFFLKEDTKDQRGIILLMAVKRSTTIPKAPLARIMTQAGAQRISSDALDALVEILEDKANEIAMQAVKISKHAGRKTINDGDIKLAVRK